MDHVSTSHSENIMSLRRVVHRELIESLETDGKDILEDPRKIRGKIQQLLNEIQERNNSAFAEDECKQVQRQILEDIGGYGPLASLMVDPEVSDILVNGPNEVWVDRNGRLDQTSIHFDDQAHLRRILDRMVATQGKHLDATSPMVDARLSNGSRLHAVIPPLCAKGAVLSIRKFRVKPLAADELIESGFLSQPMLAFLRAMVAARMNIVIAGGASAGKTTLLNLISQFIPDNERIVTIEETAELRLQHRHIVSLEGRVPNGEGFGGISLRQLVCTALRMRADRIIVGEVRGEEVLDMLQAMNVGHDGSLTTVHANSPEDVIRRLETLALTGSERVPRTAIRGMIGSAVDLIVQLARFEDGTRRIVNISELDRDSDTLEVRPLFRYHPEREAGDNRPSGHHKVEGGDCKLLQRISNAGYSYNTLIGDTPALQTRNSDEL